MRKKCHRRRRRDASNACRRIGTSCTAAIQRAPFTGRTCPPRVAPVTQVQRRRLQKSRHFELLKSGDAHRPVCTTCHRAAGIRRPSPKTLESECRRCHGPGGMAARPGRAQEARALQRAVNEARDSLDGARRLIARVGDEAHKQRLEVGYGRAEVCADAGGGGRSRIRVQQPHATGRRHEKQPEAVLGQLANPR